MSCLTVVFQVSVRRQNVSSVCPKIPQGFKDYLLKTCNYVLQDKNSSTLSVPTVSIFTVRCSKILSSFLFLFSNEMLIIWTGIHKMLIRIANREDSDQTASSEAV